MATSDLKLLLERAEAWPEEARAELIAAGRHIESQLGALTYEATDEELRAIDEAVASLDAGEFATDDEVEAAFAKFRR